MLSATTPASTEVGVGSWVADPVAAGAGVQAAATLHRQGPDDVHSAWADSGAFIRPEVTEPSGDPALAQQVAELRARYRELSAG